MVVGIVTGLHRPGHQGPEATHMLCRLQLPLSSSVCYGRWLRWHAAAAAAPCSHTCSAVCHVRTGVAPCPAAQTIAICACDHHTSCRCCSPTVHVQELPAARIHNHAPAACCSSMRAAGCPDQTPASCCHPPALTSQGLCCSRLLQTAAAACQHSREGAYAAPWQAHQSSLGSSRCPLARRS